MRAAVVRPTGLKNGMLRHVVPVLARVQEGSVRMRANADVMQRAMWGPCRPGAYECEARHVRTPGGEAQAWSARRGLECARCGRARAWRRRRWMLRGGGDGVPQAAALEVWMPGRLHERAFVRRASCAQLRLRVVWMEWRRMLSAHRWYGGPRRLQRADAARIVDGAATSGRNVVVGVLARAVAARVLMVPLVLPASA
ncbi:hypothetical protein DFH09DRAFT_1091025 [Mycena vulgaris]|nr:hypothetical protein DFH09DRAFT_1091025 [Mycena vulgaris]